MAYINIFPHPYIFANYSHAIAPIFFMSNYEISFQICLECFLIIQKGFWIILNFGFCDQTDLRPNLRVNVCLFGRPPLLCNGPYLFSWRDTSTRDLSDMNEHCETETKVFINHFSLYFGASAAFCIVMVLLLFFSSFSLYYGASAFFGFCCIILSLILLYVF